MRGGYSMYCPECNHCLDGLEEKCRQDFNREWGQYFHNLGMIRIKKWYWRGMWIGVLVDFLLICFFFGLGGWSWSGFLKLANHMWEKDVILLLVPVFIPIMAAMVGALLVFENADIEEKQAYQKFRETYGHKNTELKKDAL